MLNILNTVEMSTNDNSRVSAQIDTKQVLGDVGKSVMSPHGYKVSIGSTWDYDRSLDHAQSTIGLIVKNIQEGGLGTIVQFEQKMPYEWYGLGYFDGKTFKPHIA